MSGGLTALETALRGLRAHQQALNVTAHNVANANTPGFTRQDVQFRATPAQSVSGAAGQVGTGVKVAEIRRMRDAFLDEQLRNETSTHGRYNALYLGLSEIETFFSEPSEHGLRTVLAKFWGSFQDVANEPESDAVRRTAIQSGEALAETLRHMSSQMTGLSDSLKTAISSRVSEINQISRQIADLNRQIATIAARPGEQPNDLKDNRDLLIDRLSSLVRVQVTEDETSQVRVTINGVSVVNGLNVSQVEFSETAFGEARLTVGGYDVLTSNLAQLNGEIAGMIDLRQRISGVYLKELDALALQLITSTNQVHRMGYGLSDVAHVPRDFFTGTSAASIRVSAEIVASPSKLAASATGKPGDGQQALALARLKEQMLMQSNTATFDEFLLGVIGKLGVEAMESRRFLENQLLLIKEINTHREQVQGVSLDEEMANMVRFQHAYNACARLITTIDQMLEQLINRTGVAGR